MEHGRSLGHQEKKKKSISIQGEMNTTKSIENIFSKTIDENFLNLEK